MRYSLEPKYRKYVQGYGFLDPRQSRQGSYKFSPIHTSICDGHFLRWAFLENGSFNFSETWHEVRVL